MTTRTHDLATTLTDKVFLSKGKVREITVNRDEMQSVLLIAVELALQLKPLPAFHPIPNLKLWKIKKSI